MSPPELAITLALDIAACVLGAYWSIGIARVVATLRRVPGAHRGLSLPGSGLSACVVVPAHNEGAIIGGMVASLRAQDHPAARFVLCLDRCSDHTEERAIDAVDGDARFEIVRIDHCPPDWAGKVHAVWSGVRHSEAARRADVLVFADADTTWNPSCLRSTLALMESEGLGMLSLLSTLTCERWFERVVQPAATLEMVTQYPLVRAGRERDRRAFANGQFMMFRRDLYDSIGGHAAVRGELLEDMALARLAAEKGARARVVVAGDMLRCRMYGNWASFRRGWKRIYTELARQRTGRMLRNAWRVLVFGTMLPTIALGAGAWASVLLARGHLAAGVAGLCLVAAAFLIQGVVIGAVFRMARTPLWCLPAYPIGAAVVAALIHDASRDLRHGRGIRWGGRVYSRTPR